MASVFCEHRRVKTTCPACKPRPAAPAAVPEAPTGRAPGVRPEAPEPGDAGDAPPQARGPGKPLLPQRRRARKVTAEDAERAEAWWVKRG